MKTILWWILVTITAVVIFCVGIMLIPMQKKVVETVELTYIFVDEDGNEYDIFEPVHGAATDRSFLFEDEDWWISWLQINDVKENNLEIPNKDYLSEIIESWNNQISNDKDLQDKIEELLVKDIPTTEQIETNEKFVEIIDEKVYKSCQTPWNRTIKHWESVIAYEQREDVPSVCNAQRRTCNDWFLGGSFVQSSCKEDVEYKYTRVRAISYNERKVSDLVQTPKYAKNDGAEFDTDGKINPESREPQTSRDNTINDGIYNESEVELKRQSYYSCTSPWWEVVQHWQFVKAYESPLWFTDQPCKVELRLCLNWSLNGRYSYKTCQAKGITSQDYRWWNWDVTVPSQELLDEINKDNSNKRWLFGRFIGWFR